MARRFKWIDWNLSKIDAHGLSAAEVEAAFERVVWLKLRHDGSFEMAATTPSGRPILVVWRYDQEEEELLDVFFEEGDPAIFVITAF